MLSYSRVQRKSFIIFITSQCKHIYLCQGYLQDFLKGALKMFFNQIMNFDLKCSY